MKNFPTSSAFRALIALGLTFSAAAAVAQAVPAERIGEFLRNSADFTGEALPRLRGDFRVTETPASSAVLAIPDNLWEKLPNPSTLTGSESAAFNRLGFESGFNVGNARVLTFPAADALFAAAVAQQRSPLDFFTDPAFRNPARVYYMTQSTISRLFTRYDLRVLTPESGETDNDTPLHFSMIGLGIGNNRIDSLYDRDRVTYRHPLFEFKTFRYAQHVVERIQGPSDIGVEGVEVYVVGYRKIQRVTATSVVVDGKSYAASPTTPIRRRTPN